MNKNLQTSIIVFGITFTMMFLHEKLIAKKEFNIGVFLKEGGFISVISAIVFYVIQDFLSKTPDSELLHTNSYDA